MCDLRVSSVGVCSTNSYVNTGLGYDKINWVESPGEISSSVHRVEFYTSMINERRMMLKPL